MSHALAVERHGGRRPPVTHLQENDRCRNRRLREVGSVLARHTRHNALEHRQHPVKVDEGLLHLSNLYSNLSASPPSRNTCSPRDTRLYTC